jgi:Na+-transporting NADH:ubiquinone oxidoreductase subunit C
MKKFSNKYIFLYAAILVAVAAVTLTVVSVSLKPRQLRNQEIERKQMLLRAIGIEASAAEAEEQYGLNITEDTLWTDNDGVRQALPYYIFREGVVLPFRGTGLWGPIWGYIAVDEDLTVKGAVFDHKGETPGLGGEIAADWFAHQFVGKSLLEDGVLSPIVLKKHANPNSPHEVDAISGGTMTSDGVTQMLADGVESYRSLLEAFSNVSESEFSDDVDVEEYE